MVELRVTWEQVDEMTLPQVKALNRHFAKVPPLRVSVIAIASALGVKFPQPAPEAGADVAVPAPDFVELPEFE